MAFYFGNQVVQRYHGLLITAGCRGVVLTTDRHTGCYGNYSEEELFALYSRTVHFRLVTGPLATKTAPQSQSIKTPVRGLGGDA